MWVAAPPAPAPGGRADGAGRKGSAGRAPGCPHLRAWPPLREGAGCVSSFTLCAARRRPGRRPGRFVLAGGDSRSRVGSRWRDRGRPCACPLPERPALTLRSYCGRSAASLGRSASDKAPPGLVAAEATTQRARRTICGRGLQPPGPPFFMFVMVWRRPPGLRELGEAGERRPSGVGLPAVSHGPFQPPKPYRPPAPARSGLRLPGVTAEPGKSPGGMLRDPGSLREKGGVRNEGRLEGGTRPYARAPISRLSPGV